MFNEKWQSGIISKEVLQDYVDKYLYTMHVYSFGAVACLGVKKEKKSRHYIVIISLL